MSGLTQDTNAGAMYRDPAIFAHYKTLEKLLPEEHVLFGKYVGKSKRILELGVGGGRTTPALSADAEYYLGTDVSPEMVHACRERFPALCFEIMDASDLSALDDQSFDIVVFSYNGIGHLHPDSARKACLNEVCRVLKPGGIYIFSAHYAGTLFPHLPPHLHKPGSLRSILGTTIANLSRSAGALSSKAFWGGAGYLVTPVHGTSARFFRVTPKRMRAELSAAGFDTIEYLADRNGTAWTWPIIRWFHYTCRKR